MTANFNAPGGITSATVAASCTRLPTLLIEIDDRERCPSVIARLRDIGPVEIRRIRLAVGDYRVDHVLVFERKTLVDLVSSIKDGRLFRQALRLAESRRPCALILEGRSASLAGCDMSWSAIQGALISVAMVIGVPVLRTRTPAETADTLRHAARQHAFVVCGARPTRGKRPNGKRALQCRLLQALPGIGPKRALRLLRQFNSIQAIVAADSRALAQVEGIGRQVAAGIRWAVEERSASYLPATVRSPASLPGASLGYGVGQQS